MKRKLSIESWVLGICLAGIALLSGCEPLVVDPCKERTNLRIQRFREYCYDVAGNVVLTHPDGYADKEWMIPVATDQEVHTIFNRLTGLEVHPTEKYEYSYHSEDYRYVVRIVGTAQPADKKYASLYLEVEGCPEIETIHLVGTSE